MDISLIFKANDEEVIWKGQKKEEGRNVYRSPGTEGREGKKKNNG
jgi:hypothetical protein